jgi:uncharacterized phage infection (PIP) family protein YhgE
MEEEFLKEPKNEKNPITSKAEKVESLLRLTRGEFEGQEDTVRQLAVQELSTLLGDEKLTHVPSEIQQIDNAIKDIFSTLMQLNGSLERQLQQSQRLAQAPQYQQQVPQYQQQAPQYQRQAPQQHRPRRSYSDEYDGD